jgi:hypothetical protein
MTPPDGAASNNNQVQRIKTLLKEIEKNGYGCFMLVLKNSFF